MKQYEYKDVHLTGYRYTPQLNEQGQDGWELVCVDVNEYGYFKREIEQCIAKEDACIHIKRKKNKYK